VAAGLFVLALCPCLAANHNYKRHHPIGVGSGALLALLLTSVFISICAIFIQTHAWDTFYFSSTLEKGIARHETLQSYL
jgi:hypothetical protein